MSSLRVLLVESDPVECERISQLLENAQHQVLPLTAIDEAAEALDLQRFDAILVPAEASREQVEALAAKVRKLEASARLKGHVPIVAVSTENGASYTEKSWIEAYLPGDFAAQQFSTTVSRLAQTVAAIPPAATLAATTVSHLPVFDSAEFQEQVCFDRELMVEIIDLYLEESRTQVKEMRSLLQAGNYAQLSRVAHTIKGSLSSLHAPRARAHAQELEHAAKADNKGESAAAFAALELDLAELAPELVSFRDS